MRKSAVLFVLGTALLLGVSAPRLCAAEGDVVVSGRVTSAEDGSGIAGATVSVPALNVSAPTDRTGRYTLTIPAASVQGQEVEIRVVSPGVQSKTAKVRLSAGSLTQDFVLAFTFQQEVTVGSRAMGTAAEKAVPVDILTEKQIESASGSAETAHIIESLTPSFNFPRPTISDGTDSVRPATLRSLGPDQMLVLINGKRRHTSALVNVNGTIGRGSTGVDLNAIPAFAIEKVEILRDGAAAQYGSDAIAGVLNIVLKSGVSPLGLRLQGGTTTHSDGEIFDADGSYGAAIGRGSITFTGEYRKRNPTNRAGNDDQRDQIKAGDKGNNPVQQPSYHWGDAKERDILGFVNGSIPLNDDGTTNFYLFGGASRRDGVHGGNYRRALQGQNWPSIYPLGFLPLIEPKIVDYSGTAGLRGVLGEKWFWDLSAQYGHDRFDFNVTNSLNTSLGPTIPPNQTNFYAGSLVFNQFIANLDLTREVDLGMAGPLNVAFGAEFRRENYQEIAGETNSWVDGGSKDQFGNKAPAGAQVFPGFRPSNAVDASRNNVAAYVDVEGNVTSFLRLGLAGRFEHYTDFGNTEDVKVTARVEASKHLVFRGAASTGFRAPSLGQTYFSAISTNFLKDMSGTFVPFDVGHFRVNSDLARALGAKDLKPEDSVNYSGGFVVSPSNAFDFTADYFYIKIKDRIILSGNFTGPSLNTILAPFNATGARFFTNAIDTRTEGVELTANYKADLRDAGILRFQAAYAHSRNTITRIAPTPPQLAGLQETLFDRLERRRLECAQPRDNVRLTGDWRKGGFGAVVRGSRYGSFCGIDNTLEKDDQTFSAKWLMDVDLSYQIGHVGFAAGVENIFDTFPDKSIAANNNFGIFTYPRNSPFGFNGRYVYFRTSYVF
ncbi:MAG TPA: TonB-dependent receptor [Thermoanaerobaculia bacterium]|nr:TonB-dependent receptor [Thermoanaerobaculia bacterium]